MGIRKIPEETESYVYLSKNPRNRRSCDCVIRAISAAYGMDWEEVYSDLFDIGMVEKAMMDEPKVYTKFLDKHSYGGKMKQLKNSDGTKLTGKKFCDWADKEFPKHDQNIVCHIGGHHSSVCMPCFNSATGEMKYKFHDIWDCTGGCVGNWWMVK